MLSDRQEDFTRRFTLNLFFGYNALNSFSTGDLHEAKQSNSKLVGANQIQKRRESLTVGVDHPQLPSDLELKENTFMSEHVRTTQKHWRLSLQLQERESVPMPVPAGATSLPKISRAFLSLCSTAIQITASLLF